MQDDIQGNPECVAVYQFINYATKAIRHGIRDFDKGWDRWHDYELLPDDGDLCDAPSMQMWLASCAGQGTYLFWRSDGLGEPMEFPRAFVLHVQEITDEMELYADHLDSARASMPEIRQLSPVPEGSYLIETAKSPEELLRDGYGEDLRVAFTSEQDKALANLNELAVRIENQGNIEHPFDKPVIEEYRGAAAIRHFLREKMEDAELSRQWNKAETFRRGNRKEMALSYHGEEFARIHYEQGSAQLVEQCPKGLPEHPREQERREMQEAVYQQFRYQGERPYGIRDLMQKPELQRPDMELLREEAKAQRPGDKAINEQWYEYYAAIAQRDYANDTPEKFQQTVVEQMKANGLSKQKMTNIAKVNPKFDVGLVMGKEAGEKTAGKKRTKRAVVAETAKEHSRERERERVINDDR